MPSLVHASCSKRLPFKNRVRDYVIHNFKIATAELNSKGEALCEGAGCLPKAGPTCYPEDINKVSSKTYHFSKRLASSFPVPPHPFLAPEPGGMGGGWEAGRDERADSTLFLGQFPQFRVQA